MFNCLTVYRSLCALFPRTCSTGVLGPTHHYLTRYGRPELLQSSLASKRKRLDETFPIK